MTAGLKFRTVRWKYIASIEPPSVVHMREESVIEKDNFYVQVTVRLSSQQVFLIDYLFTDTFNVFE